MEQTDNEQIVRFVIGVKPVLQAQQVVVLSQVLQLGIRHGRTKQVGEESYESWNPDSQFWQAAGVQVRQLAVRREHSWQGPLGDAQQQVLQRGVQVFSGWAVHSAHSPIAGENTQPLWQSPLPRIQVELVVHMQPFEIQLLSVLYWQFNPTPTQSRQTRRMIILSMITPFFD